MKARGAAAVVMTHRSAAIEACDVLLLLEAGQVRGFGPREQMMRAMLRAAPGPRPAPAAAPTAGEDARHGEDTVPMFRAAPRPVPGRAGGGQ
jgi:ABC-type protease/lipase transport system fused ATPase/permease subunit